MREILFRGKRTDNGQWIEGYYMKHINRTPAVINDQINPEDIEHIILFDAFSDWNMPRGINYVHVDPSTVGQYTGKDDTKQHKAFVDDIICYSNTHIVYGIIRFGEIPNLEGRVKHIGYYIEWQNDGANLWNDWWRCDLGYWLNHPSCEICGNIHDNPELIEETDHD